MFITTTDRFSFLDLVTNFQRTGLQICNKGPELADHNSTKNKNIIIHRNSNNSPRRCRPYLDQQRYDPLSCS